MLRLPAITTLNLLHTVNAVHTGSLDIQKCFHKVFQGLGSLRKAYVIRLKEGTVPHALYTPRNVPIPLHGKVQEEL